MENMIPVIFYDYIFTVKVSEYYCEIICIRQLSKLENQNKKHFKMDLIKQEDDQDVTILFSTIARSF